MKPDFLISECSGNLSIFQLTSLRVNSRFRLPQQGSWCCETGSGLNYVSRARRRNDAVHIAGADRVSVTAICQGRQYRMHQSGDKQYRGCGDLCDCNLRLAIFLEDKMMVVFGAANLAILLVVMAFKRYAFASLWCAYAAIASVIILAYFWKSKEERPVPVRVEHRW
jgi:hypothetical protein